MASLDNIVKSIKNFFAEISPFFRSFKNFLGIKTEPNIDDIVFELEKLQALESNFDIPEDMELEISEKLSKSIKSLVELCKNFKEVSKNVKAENNFIQFRKINIFNVTLSQILQDIKNLRIEVQKDEDEIDNYAMDGESDKYILPAENLVNRNSEFIKNFTERRILANLSKSPDQNHIDNFVQETIVQETIVQETNINNSTLPNSTIKGKKSINLR